MSHDSTLQPTDRYISNKPNFQEHHSNQTMRTHLLVLVITILFQDQFPQSSAQQPYLDNRQLDCQDNTTFTGGYFCYPNSTSSCRSYATFRTTSLYNSPATVGYLLSASPLEISLLNKLSSDVAPLPQDTLLLIPLDNCSCFEKSFYQHNASYTIKTADDNYYTIANLTYEGLSTCQALILQNTIDTHELEIGDKVNIPLRCACPSKNQTELGYKYLLSYLVTWGDSVDAIADMFGADNQSILAANELTEDSIIYPFNPILVPLKSEPVIKASLSPAPDPSSPNVPAVTVGKGNGNDSSRKWVFIGIGIGVAVLLLFMLLGFVFCLFNRKQKPQNGPIQGQKLEGLVIPPDSNSWSVSSETARFAIGSLTLYKFEELEKATSFFDEGNRIKGTVYRGSFKGDEAAVKVMKGDVSEEIGILKQINHSNIVRLSGFCVHDGNTYLVYEYMDNGSLDDLLHCNSIYSMTKSDGLQVLGWKQRVQIAYDVADALNYLHNYANPPYIHKNLKSSNILIAGDWRAKLSNFGLARSLRENEDLHMTRHVVGTHGYMAPEYIENGLVTPKLDVYSFGVILLEILSGKEAANKGKSGNEKNELLSDMIREVLGGENVRGKLKEFIDTYLGKEYPFDLAYSLAQLAKNCVANDLNSRPSVAEVFMTLSKILSSSMYWDPSEELDSYSRSLSHGR